MEIQALPPYSRLSLCCDDGRRRHQSGIKISLRSSPQASRDNNNHFEVLLLHHHRLVML